MYYVYYGGEVMILNCIVLALSVSIDSFGIGITYGIKNTKITNLSKLILFIVSLIATIISINLGKIISKIRLFNISCNGIDICFSKFKQKWNY